MSGKHKNPIAAIYMMTCLENGKIYIGETCDILNRMSAHRNVHRRREVNIRTKIEKAIVKHGYNTFVTTIFTDSNQDPKLHDNAYRRKLEAEYINKYNSTDPSIGYNSVQEYYVRLPHSHHGHKLTKATKIKLSKPILVYDKNSTTTMLYISAESYSIINGLSDASIATAACKHGRTIHDQVFFRLDKNKRKNDINDVINSGYKIWVKGIIQFKTINKMRNYIFAAYEINSWCQQYGYDTVNINKILKQYPDEYIELIT